MGCCWERGGWNAAKSLFVWRAPAQGGDEGNQTVDEKKRKYMRPRHPRPDTTTLQPDNVLRW